VIGSGAGLVGPARDIAARFRGVVTLLLGDAIRVELSDIEGILDDDRLSDEDRTALHGAQQALRNILEPDTSHPASQTFYRIGARPIEMTKTSRH
jgi:hypothetical protein